ncbi:MAG: protein kinase, partial [Acidobacteriota bacterium]
EAMAVAALSHPNILGIYDLGMDGGATYAVMELLVGETLRQRLEESPLPARKALEFGLQIAQGLAAAHEKGIVHRDLKPENIFLTSDGRVKILDFGLAKVAVPDDAGTKSPTAVAATEPGTVMGTVGYMSPEQVRGKPADPRSDIFSFGSVLYEMLSGQRAFRGDSAAETMAAIAQKDPPELSEASGKFSPAVERILRHCLEKRPEERFDTAHDLAFALETAMGGSSAPRIVVEAPKRRRAVPAALAALAGLILLAAGITAGRMLQRPEQPNFRQLTFHRGYLESARFSPDGQTVIYGSSRRGEPVRVSSTRLDSIESRTLDLPPATVLGISRTGEMLLLLQCVHRGYWVRSGTLARAPLGGGAPREILENVGDADISPNGKALAVVREIGNQQRLEFPLGKQTLQTEGWVSHPRISPDGRRVAFIEHPAYGNDDGYISLADAGGPPRRLTRKWLGAQGLAWSANGKEIYFTGGQESGSANSVPRHQVWALKPGDSPRLVYGAPIYLRLHDISASGEVLVSGEDWRGEIGGLLQGDTNERELTTWSDEALSGISDDGVVYAGHEQTAEPEPFLYYRRAAEGSPVRLGPGVGFGVSPDGRWVLSIVPAGVGKLGLTLVPTGPGDPRPVSIGTLKPWTTPFEKARWSSDGTKLLIPASEPGKRPRLWLADLAGGGSIRPATPEGASLGVLSPDGKAVAAVGEDGRILIHPLGESPIPVRGTITHEIPLQWETGGNAIFVWDRTWPARIMRVELSTGTRSAWKELAADPLGLLYGNVHLTRDGRHYVYRIRRAFSELNVARGLK